MHYVNKAFKRLFLTNPEEKKQISEMSGKIILWILEGRSIWYMADNLHLDPAVVEQIIDDLSYVLMRKVGKKRFIKTLFTH